MITCTHFHVQLYPIVTHLGWSGGIDLGPVSVLFFKVSDSIFSDVNLSGLI